MTEVLVLQHIGCEAAGTIGDVLDRAGIATRVIRAYQGEEVPAALVEGQQGLIVMGGPMGVYEGEKYPFLPKEMRLIEQTLKTGRPILGICLGSQLLASVLGAPVVPGKLKEIGWFPLKLTPDAVADTLFSVVRTGFMGLHWHGGVFPLPKSASRLAGSELTEVQAYRYGPSAYGILFHMELTEPMLREWVREFDTELTAAGVRPESILDGIDKRIPTLKEIGTRVFSRWADLVSPKKKVSQAA